MQKGTQKSFAKKILALLLGMTMVLSLFTATAFAADGDETQKYKVSVTNGAASANTDELSNGLHVYTQEAYTDPDTGRTLYNVGDDINGEVEVAAGTEMAIDLATYASAVRLVAVHNGVTVIDKVYEQGGTYSEVIESLQGDLTVTTEAADAASSEVTVTIDNQVGGDPSVQIGEAVVANGGTIAKGTYNVLVQGDYITDELMAAYVTLFVNGEQIGEPTEIGYDDAAFENVNITGNVVIKIAPYEEPQEEKVTFTASIGEDVPGEVMVYVDTDEIKGSAEITKGTHSFTVYGDYSEGQENAMVTLTVNGSQVGETVTDLNGYTGVEFTNVDVTGDVVLTIAMPKLYTVSYENKVAEENVTFNVMTVDYSGETPAPAPIENGSSLKEGSYVGVQVLNPLNKKLIVTQYNANGKVVDSSVIDEAAEEEEGAGGIIIPELDSDVRFVLSYAHSVKVTNGAAAANTDYNVNGLHVYSTDDPKETDIDGEVYLAEGTPIEIFAYPTASSIHLTIKHNGEVVVDKNLDRIQAFVDDDKIEWFNYDLAGDLEVTTSAAFTVNVTDQVQSDDVTFNVATVDFSSGTPQQVILNDGDTVMAGEMVASNVINDGTDMLKLSAVKEDGTLIEEQYIAPGCANGIMITEAASHVRFILSKGTAALDSVGTVALSKASYSYTGKAVKPIPTVTAAFGVDEVTLVKGTDYTVKYSNNIKVGTATVTITGKGNYTGTLKKTYKIAAKSLAKAKVTAKVQTYTGSLLKPAVTVKLGDTTLVRGTDYTVKYSNNKKPGKATITITGKGNYKGTATGKFTIVRAKNPMTLKAAEKKVTLAKVTKAKQTVSPLTVKNAQGKVTYAKKSGSKYLTVNTKTGAVTVAKGTKKGTYTANIRVTAAGNTYYKKLIKTIKVKVTVK